MQRTIIGSSLIIAALLISSIAEAAIAPKYEGKIILDQSKDVLFEDFSQNTFSLQLLQTKKTFDHKSLVLGGVLEADLQHWHGNRILTTNPSFYQTGSGLYLTQATFDIMANPNHWGMVFLSVSGTQLGQGGSSGNYYYSPQSFLLLGNLDRFPVYATIGISTIPFAPFVGGDVWSTPLTYSYFNPQQAPQISIAYFKNNLSLDATFYNDEINHEDHWVAAVNYNNNYRNLTYSAGAGYVSNLKTNSTGDIGTLGTRVTIPDADMGKVWDVNATIGYQLLSFSAEYLQGSSQVMGNYGKPGAYCLTASFAPTLYNQTTTFGITRSMSMGLSGVPTTLTGQDGVLLANSGLKNSWLINVSRPIFRKNISLSLDAERAVAYGNQITYAYTLDLLFYL